MDRLDNNKRLDPRVAARMRYYDLERLEPLGMTKCDRCKAEVKKAEAIELWRGSECVFVTCLGCLRGSGIEVVSLPDGLHINEKNSNTGLVRSSRSTLPAAVRPVLGGRR